MPYEKHALFNTPINPNQKIWRYIDFTKFEDLLCSESIFFSRADKFDDPFEGSLPRLTAKSRNHIMKDLISRGVVAPGYTEEWWEEQGKQNKEIHYINCWHMNDYESAAMWKLYAKSNKGISIQSTYNKLVSTLDKSIYRIFIGTVNYIDYETDNIDWAISLSPFVIKRKSFEYEKELRAVIWALPKEIEDADLSPGGIRVSIHLSDLIESIHVSPDCPKGLTEHVYNTCKKYGFDFEVKNSALDDTPLF